jgi:hypothetical protein
MKEALFSLSKFDIYQEVIIVRDSEKAREGGTERDRDSERCVCINTLNTRIICVDT